MLRTRLAAAFVSECRHLVLGPSECGGRGDCEQEKVDEEEIFPQGSPHPNCFRLLSRRLRLSKSCFSSPVPARWPASWLALGGRAYTCMWPRGASLGARAAGRNGSGSGQIPCLYINNIPVHKKYTRPLTFENVWKAELREGGRERAL